jgi:hypothetical protein
MRKMPAARQEKRVSAKSGTYMGIVVKEKGRPIQIQRYVRCVADRGCGKGFAG